MQIEALVLAGTESKGTLRTSMGDAVRERFNRNSISLRRDTISTALQTFQILTIGIASPRLNVAQNHFTPGVAAFPDAKELTYPS